MPVHNRPAFESGSLLDDMYFPGAVAARHARAGEAHVASLNDWVRRVADHEGERVPFFDPASGGLDARVLVLLQDPSRVAAYGSRLISRHNNDRTAANTSTACALAGLDYGAAVHWNVIPWWAQDPERPDPRTGRPRSIPSQARRATPYLLELLDLLPRLRSVLLLGVPARRAWAQTRIDAGARGIGVFSGPHPGAQAWNNRDRTTGRPNSELTVEAIALAARHADA